MAELYLLFACHDQLVPCLLGCCHHSPASPCARFPLPAWHPQSGVPVTGSAQPGTQLGLAEEMFLFAQASLVLGVGRQACRAVNAVSGPGKRTPVQGRAVQLPPGTPFPRMARGSPSTRARLNRLVAAWKNARILSFCLKSGSGINPSRSSQAIGSRGSWQIELARPGLAAPRPFVRWSRGSTGLCFRIAGGF